MFIPVGDDNRDRRITPVVNYLFIFANILVFILLQEWGRDVPFTYGYSTVPAEILSGRDIVSQSKVVVDELTGQVVQIPGLAPTHINVYLTLLTSMFMHGGLAHIIGNLLFLVIFGDNIEDALGHLNYFIFYLLCGILAGLAHVFSTYFFGQSPYIPSLGASGAISGVLGGYIVLFPTRKVHVWILLFTVSVPAFIAVGLWFVFQVINGLGALGGDEAAGGIAYAAHIGGFIAGLILVKMFAKKRKKLLVEERKSFW